MSDDRSAGAVPDVPPAIPIGSAPTWIIKWGAVSGGFTLVCFFAFALISGLRPDFACNAFIFAAAAFAFGAALAAGFIGGAAAIQGKLGSAAQDNVILFSAGGGVAVLFIAFFAFHFLKGNACDNLQDKVTKLKTQIDTLDQQVLSLHKSLGQKDVELKQWRERPLTIIAESNQREVGKLIVTYRNELNRQVDAAREFFESEDVYHSTFKIPHKISDDFSQLTVKLDPGEQPAQREGKPPPLVGITRIEHSIEPLRIRLFIKFAPVAQPIE